MLSISLSSFHRLAIHIYRTIKASIKPPRLNTNHFSSHAILNLPFSGHRERSRSNSASYPIDRNALMNWVRPRLDSSRHIVFPLTFQDYDEYVQQVSRGLRPALYQGMVSTAIIRVNITTYHEQRLPCFSTDTLSLMSHCKGIRNNICLNHI